MTFEGRNFDILAGITTPIIVLFLYYKNNKKVLLIWNIITLSLLLFILANGILSSAMTYELFGFSQANKAIMYFPYILLPGVIVPIVFYTQLSDIVLIVKNLKK